MGNLMNESLRALLNEQYKLVAELREENKDLKEWKENLIWADKKKSDHIDELEEEIEKLKKENEELKEYKAMYEGLCK